MRWIDSLDLESVDEIPEDVRITRALDQLAHSFHLENGLGGRKNEYMELLVSSASALIVSERRRLTEIIGYPAIGVSIKKRGDYAADGSLLYAVHGVTSALVALEDHATALAVSHLRTAEAELRCRWRYQPEKAIPHTPLQEVLDQRREKRGR